MIKGEYRTALFKDKAEEVTNSNFELIFPLKTLKQLQDSVDKVANVSTELKQNGWENVNSFYPQHVFFADFYQKKAIACNSCDTS